MKSFVCLAVVVLALLGEQVVTAAVTGRRKINPTLVVGDAAGDTIVDTALEYVISELVAEGLDPAPFDADLVGINIEGTMTGLSTLYRDGDVTPTTQGQQTIIAFEFSVNNVLASFAITSDTDATVDGHGSVSLPLVTVYVTAAEQNDGSYDISLYSPSDITGYTITLSNLGNLEDYSTQIRTLVEGVFVDTVTVTVDDTILDLLGTALRNQ